MPNYRRSAAFTTARAAMAAVSVRRICGPSDTGVQPAACAAVRSTSVQPPSGPIINETSGGSGTSADRIGMPVRSSSRKRRAGPSELSALLVRSGSRNSGRWARRDCWLLSSTIRAQRGKALLHGTLESFLGPVRIHKRDAVYAQLGRLLENQLQAFELDQREIEVYRRNGRRLRQLFQYPEYDLLLARCLHLGQIKIAVIRNLVALSRFHAQDLGEVASLVPLQFSLMISDFVNKETTASHAVKQSNGFPKRV
jgi:hypothetical protein